MEKEGLESLQLYDYGIRMILQLQLDMVRMYSIKSQIIEMVKVIGAPRTIHVSRRH